MDRIADRRCPRCSGCGRVAGTGREEHAWCDFRGLPNHLAIQRALGMRAPLSCPDCLGTGVQRRFGMPDAPPPTLPC